MIKIDKLNFSIDDVSTRFIEKVNRNEYFVRWGLDNMEIERWYDYADYSPIHSACIRSKVDNASGRGFINDYRINTKETLNDVVKQMFWEIRSDGWLYCNDWLNWRKNGVIEFAEFDPKNFTDRQIIHIKQYQPGYLFYGVPDYLSSILDIRLSRAISAFNLANISNGASPSMWVHFPTEAPDSQNDQEDILRRLEERYRGSQNAGRIMVSYGGEGGKPEITQMTPTMATGGYAEIFALVRENILAGHKVVDGSIIGLPSPTGFNSSAEQLETTYKLFMNTCVKPLQEFLLREITPVVKLIYPGEDIKLEIEQNQIV